MIVDEWLLDAGFINLNQHFHQNKQGQTVHKTDTKKQKNRKTEKQKNRETEKQKNRKTEKQ